MLHPSNPEGELRCYIRASEKESKKSIIQQLSQQHFPLYFFLSYTCVDHLDQRACADRYFFVTNKIVSLFIFMFTWMEAVNAEAFCKLSTMKPRNY